MKSAYEIAMERMEKESGPSRKLTEEEKAEAAAIDAKYEAKIAEVHLQFDPKIAATPPPESDGLKRELAAEVSRLESKRDDEKDAIWNRETK